MFYTFFVFFWFIVTIKAILFWLYLWQLKEYHIGRFLAHFQTEKGKSIFLNKTLFFKLFLLITLLTPFFFVFSFLILFALYSFEAVKTLTNFIKKKVKKPVLTAKALVLILISFSIEIILTIFIIIKSENALRLSFWLLVFDIFIPLVVSIAVILFQPFVVLARNIIIKKATEKRNKFNKLIVIGIAGSYGKTSTKEFLSFILSEKYKVLKTEEHQNSEMGISRCILKDLNQEHEIFVCEMGAYKKGGVKLLCDIAQPKIGILTGINEQHMATFGSQENIIKTKYELIENLPANGTAFFNAKNKYCLELYNKTKIKKFLYGENAKFLGEENILGAVAVVKEIGMTEEEINRALKKIENKFPGVKVKKNINGLNIVDATYSANPDGVVANLEYLKTFPGKKIIVMPCLIELGKASKEIHKRIGQKIAEVCDLAIITTKDMFKEIKEEVLLRNDAPARQAVEILYMDNPKKIFEKIKEFTKEGDAVLLESRVPEELKELLA